MIPPLQELPSKRYISDLTNEVYLKSSKFGPTALAIKLGPKLLSLLFKLIKSLKVLKVGLAAISMIGYSYMFSWEFAALIMVSLFVHESGHVWAMRHCGMHVKGIFFIPFIGGAAVTDSAFKTRSDEVFVALMGPVWGLLLSLGTAIPYFITKNPLFAAAASWMAMINLFNLLPINPLDGGRVVKSIAFSISSYGGKAVLICSILASIYLAYKTHLGLFAFLTVLCLIEAVLSSGEKYFFVKNGVEKYKRYIAMYPYAFDKDLSPMWDKKNPEDFSRVKKKIEDVFDEEDSYQIPKLTPHKIVLSTLSYLTLVGVLWSLMHYTSEVPGASIAMEILK